MSVGLVPRLPLLDPVFIQGPAFNRENMVDGSFDEHFQTITPNQFDLLISISKNPFSLIILLFSPIIGVFYEAFNVNV